MNHLTRNGSRTLAAVPPFLPFETLPMPLALTPRECEVLRCLATGKTDADIGEMLGISTRTVQKHLEHIYVKLGVETRTAAVMRALGMPLDANPPLHA